MKDELITVVSQSYEHAFTVSSDFAREKAPYVAMAASLGLISTRIMKDVFSRHWRPTVKGLMFLESLQLTDEEPKEDLSDVALYNHLTDS